MDTLDFDVVTAMQINPRISWAQLGSVLMTDPSTLSRRWARLTNERLVWTGCSFMQGQASLAQQALALIEVQCGPGQREESIAYFCAQDRIFSVSCTTGSRDLTLWVGGSNLLELDHFIDTEVNNAPGVVSTRTRHMRRMFLDGSRWRAGRLSAEQTLAVSESLPRVHESEGPNPFYMDLIKAIGDDVRQPATELQRMLGKSHATIQRGIDVLMSVHWASMRVDVAHNLGGWRSMVMMWLNVRQADMENVAGRIAHFPQTRLCASMSGNANLLAAFWLKDLDELDAIELDLTTAFPRVQIADRWLIPRAAKRMGHVLDSDGRHSHYLPFGSYTGLDV